MADFRRFSGCATSDRVSGRNPAPLRSSPLNPLASLLRNRAHKESVMADKLRTFAWVQAGLLAAGLAAGAGCNSGTGGSNVSALPADVKAITFLQRPRHNDAGNVFDYTTFHPGGRLVTLSPPSADGKLTRLFPTDASCTALLGADATSDDVSACKDGADIMSYDLSFDAKSVVFSARIPGESNFQIFSMNLDGTNLQQLTTGANDFVYPLYLPGDQILF